MNEREKAEAAALESELRESERRFRLALRNAPVSVATQDRDLRFLWAYNQRTIPASEVVGKTDRDIFAPEDAERLIALKRKVLDEGVQINETLWLQSNGKRVFVNVFLEPLRDETGAITGVGIATVDLTPMKLSEEGLARSNQELEAFSYSVSHDLRNPLQTISANAEVLALSFEAESDEQKAVTHIIQATDRMAQVINDLLTLSGISRQTIRRERVNLSLIAEKFLRELRDLAPERVMESDITPDLTVDGDGGLLRLLIENLLRNAWKFTSKRKVGAIAFGRTVRDGRDWFYIRDNGVGFDAGQSDRLFKPYQRLPSAMEYKGSGIGLSIAKRVIERHNGAIWAEGEKDKGATFYFYIGQGGF